MIVGNCWFFSSLLFSSINIYFIDRDGEKRSANAKLGSNLLDVALDNNIDLEGFGQKIFIFVGSNVK